MTTDPQKNIIVPKKVRVQLFFARSTTMPFRFVYLKLAVLYANKNDICSIKKKISPFTIPCGNKVYKCIVNVLCL